MKPKRKGGAPAGNRNAAKAETAKRTNVRLYGQDQELAWKIAKKLDISRDAGIRKAIQELAQRLGLIE